MEGWAFMVARGWGCGLECRHALAPTPGDHKGRPYYGRAWQDASWHSRGDGLSSPWGGVVALLGSLLPAVPIMDGEWYICASRMKSRFCGLPAVPIMDGECYPGMATHSSTVKRLPCPSVLSTAIEPPMAVTRSWTIASPSPKPPVVRVREASER